jgi:hypothetical protein
MFVIDKSIKLMFHLKLKNNMEKSEKITLAGNLKASAKFCASLVEGANQPGHPERCNG